MLPRISLLKVLNTSKETAKFMEGILYSLNLTHLTRLLRNERRRRMKSLRKRRLRSSVGRMKRQK
jgi:hypothetical protein